MGNLPPLPTDDQALAPTNSDRALDPLPPQETLAGSTAEWGAVTTGAFQIPRITLTQGQSTYLGEVPGVVPGDFCDVDQGEVLGKSITILPVAIRGHWYVYQDVTTMVGTDKNVSSTYLRKEAISATNENREKVVPDSTNSSVSYRYVKVYDLLCHIIREGVPSPVPHIVALKGFGIRAASSIITQMYMINRKYKLPPWGYFLTLLSKEEPAPGGKGNLYIIANKLGDKVDEKLYGTAEETLASCSANS